LYWKNIDQEMNKLMRLPTKITDKQLVNSVRSILILLVGVLKIFMEPFKSQRKPILGFLRFKI